MLLRETITADTYRDLTFVAQMQQWFQGRANKLAGVDGLDNPVVGAGLVSSEKPIAKGLVSEVTGAAGGAARYNHLPHGGYYISMWGNAGRHGVGVVFNAHGYAVFDQNQGMLIGPVVAPKLRALRVAMEQYEANGALIHWEMYSVKIALQAGYYGDPDVKGRSAAAAAGAGAAGAGTAAAGTAAAGSGASAAAAAGAGAAAAPDAAAEAAPRPDAAALAARLLAASQALPRLTRRRSF
ncbi:Hypothetical protein A7982_08081 [Minicystis rosea]|nr:Hypothetical protein A7982_08081 [Minicystis rosea]